MSGELILYFQFVVQLTVIMGVFILADGAYKKFKKRRKRNAK